jgi:hypothetical protein
MSFNLEEYFHLHLTQRKYRVYPSNTLFAILRIALIFVITFCILPYFEKLTLSDHHPICVCLSALKTFELQPVSMILGMYILAAELTA